MWKKIFLPVLFTGILLCSKAQHGATISLLDKEQKEKIIDELSKSLQENYVYLDTAKAMARYIQNQWHQGAYDSLDRPGLLAAAISKDLWSVYHDGHLKVRYSPGLAQSIGSGSEVNADDQKKVAEHNREINFNFNKVEVLNNNIGYLKLNGFSEVNKESKDAVDAAFRFLQHVHALIIDLRENGGGDPAMVQYICNYLFAKRTHLNDIYVRRDNTTGQFWTTPDSHLTSLMNIPIYILTSKFTFSGAEEFAYDLQTQKRAVIVGEVTGGGAHPVEPRALSNGFVLFVPFARAINPITKTNWEGKGIQPDILTTADQALPAALKQIADREASIVNRQW